MQKGKLVRICLILIFGCVFQSVWSQQDNEIRVRIDDSKQVYQSLKKAETAPLPVRNEYRSAEELLNQLYFSRRIPEPAAVLKQLEELNLNNEIHSRIVNTVFPENQPSCYKSISESASSFDRVRIANGKILLQAEICENSVSAGIDFIQKANTIAPEYTSKFKCTKLNDSTVIIDELLLGSLKFTEVRFKIAAVADETPIVLGREILSSVKLTLDDQHFNYEVQLSQSSSSKRHNLSGYKYPLIKGHDGFSKPVIMALDLQSESSCFYGDHDGDSLFYLDDIQISIPQNNKADKLHDPLFHISGVLGSDLVKGKKVKIDFASGRMDVHPPKNYLENGIYLVSGTIESGLKPDIDELNTSTMEIISYASVFTLGRPGAQENDIVVFTTEFIPLELNEPPIEIESESGFNHIELDFTDEMTKKLERFTERHIGRNLVFVAGGKAVTMQQILRPFEEKSVEISRCSPRAVDFLYLNLKDSAVNK